MRVWKLLQPLVLSSGDLPAGSQGFRVYGLGYLYSYVRLLGPKTLLYKAFGLYFDAKGCRASVRLPLWVSIGVSLVV